MSELQKPLVNTRIDDGVALIEIDHPPVNAMSQRARAELLAAIEAADENSAIDAIVIAAAGSTFVAGGDISEFGKPPLAPHLPDVVNRIEACAKPVVVAWHGTALGGGCEIGLAAHARVIDAKALLGLPEVKLGLLPGAGGTQRLPRLVGQATALDIIATGRMVSATEALTIGAADEIATGDVREAAIKKARQLIGKPVRQTSLLPLPLDGDSIWEDATARVRRDARGSIAPLKAVALVEQVTSLPFVEGQPRERAAFFELMAGEQSLALRHLFFAERATSRLPELAHVKARALAAVGVVGGGTMGAGIAVAMRNAGLDVILIEADATRAVAARERVQGLWQRSLKSGRLTPEGLQQRMAGLVVAHDLAALRKVDLVVEAVFEDMAVKRALFARLEAVLRPHAVIATNTSYLDINEMAAGLDDPSRVVGLHFFSPAHVMKLLEIVRAAQTAPDVLATALALGRMLKKISVVCGVCDGFIGNRMLARWRAACEFLLEEGALPSQIDAALEAYGFPMGPFAVQDLVGLDIAWARRKRLAPTRHPDERYVPLADQLCEMGHLGQKTERGWYLYVDGKRQPNPEVDAMVRAHAAGKGLPQRAFSVEEVQARVHAVMLNEGAKILSEGIAARASDIDVVLVHGYGYPPWRGGPMHEADRLGAVTMLNRVQQLAETAGRGFEPATLLADLARDGRGFAD